MDLSSAIAELTEEKKSIIRLFDIEDMNEPFSELEVDVVLSESITLKKSVTSSAIESGESISDNSVIEPISVRLECVTSERPVSYADYAERFEKFKNEVIDEEEEQENVYVREVKEFLLIALQHNVLAELEIGLGLVQSLSITEINYIKSADTTGMLKFNIALKEVIFASSEITDLPESELYKPKDIDKDKISSAGKSTSTTKSLTEPSDAVKKAVTEKEKTYFTQFVEFISDAVESLGNWGFMALLEIPINNVNSPYLEFSILIENTKYYFTLKYNYRIKAWYISIKDSTKNNIAEGCRLRNLVPPFINCTDIRLPNGVIYIANTSKENYDPTYESLGTVHRLVYDYDYTYKG